MSGFVAVMSGMFREPDISITIEIQDLDHRCRKCQVFSTGSYPEKNAGGCHRDLENGILRPVESRFSGGGCIDLPDIPDISDIGICKRLIQWELADVRFQKLQNRN